MGEAGDRSADQFLAAFSHNLKVLFKIKELEKVGHQSREKWDLFVHDSISSRASASHLFG
jgi:hypothetical protein